MVFAALFGLLVPRFIMVLMWLFSDYLRDAFGTWIWPFLGFFVAPTTTLCYAIAVNELNGFRGWGAVLTVLGVAVDAGLLGRGRGLLKGTIQHDRGTPA
jgi:hypothetical protein